MKNVQIVQGVIITVIGGFILALLVSECREIKTTHDAVIQLKEKLHSK